MIKCKLTFVNNLVKMVPVQHSEGTGVFYVNHAAWLPQCLDKQHLEECWVLVEEKYTKLPVEVASRQGQEFDLRNSWMALAHVLNRYPKLVVLTTAHLSRNNKKICLGQYPQLAFYVRTPLGGAVAGEQLHLLGKLCVGEAFSARNQDREDIAWWKEYIQAHLKRMLDEQNIQVRKAQARASQLRALWVRGMQASSH